MAFLCPKTKCWPILNPVEVHAADARKYSKFQLPRLEVLVFWMASTRAR